MSQRFIRCPHCGLPHDMLQVVCPATGKPMEQRRHSQQSPAIKQSAPPPPMLSTLPPGRSASRDLTGKKIGGKYLVKSVLGEGGMGTVFEAEHITIGRHVAVKVLHPNQARKKDAVKRFHQEARAAGAIGHPNICEVYDLGTLDDGSPYLVMEKLVGETLADRIASEGGLPFDDVIDVLTQVLSGLVAAHEKRIVHRDIKPENVFLTKRVGCPPVAKLLDFGVSKMIAPLLSGDREEDLDLTRTGMVMGTPYYMSPEQARGDRNLDARVDLYACGVIMYEALTGRRPFTAANYNALLLQILTTSPRPARELRPALPQGFDAVLEKAMARAREDRYQNAAEFQRDLQTLRDRHVALQQQQPAAEMARAVVQQRAAVAAPRVAHLPAHTPPNIETDRPPAPARNAQPPPAIPRPGAMPRRAEPPPPPPPREPPPPRPKEPTPSSVEIPIHFGGGDTPLSGENMPIEPTELNARNAPPPGAAEETGFEDQPTEVQMSPMHRHHGDDEHTTQKRGPELGAMLAKVVIEDDSDNSATEINVIKPGTPLKPPARKREPSSDGEGDPTLIHARVGFPKRRGGSATRRVPSSPDDTIKMSDNLEGRIQEARDRLAEREAAPPKPSANIPRPNKR